MKVDFQSPFALLGYILFFEQKNSKGSNFVEYLGQQSQL